jgi:hypothetical protein
VTAAAIGRRHGRARLDRRGVVLLVVLFAVTLLFSQSCQQSQVRIPQERAIATARAEVDFRPARTQIRLVRQGLNAKPFWAVSLSIPAREGSLGRIATVRIDANNGKVAAVNDDRGRPAP